MYSETKTPFFISWLRSHLVSITATGVDFFTTIFLTEVLRVWYVASNVTGAMAGGVVSFCLCRVWVFKARHRKWHEQAPRYVLAICLSICLNTAGVWFLTEAFHWQYILSKTLTAGVVGVTVNFLMFRYFVFK